MIRKRIYIFIAALIFIPLTSIPQIIYKNTGKSTSVGTVGNGSLVNAYKIPYKGDNFKFFSFLDYYIFGRCYVHSSIYAIVLESYDKLQKEYPDYVFRIMECSLRKGGKSFPHRTHQNGTSIDFMTPLKKGNKVITRYDKIGVFRYLMKFDSNGKKRFNRDIEIDFEKIAKHILTLEYISRQHGYRIKKVILETNLKDEIFDTKYGDALKKSGIYFVKSLPKLINELHDDHYHIDFDAI